jgi:hypothetical protein
MYRVVSLLSMSLIALDGWAHPGHTGLEANHVHVWDVSGYLVVAVVVFIGMRLVSKRSRYVTPARGK